MLAWVLALGSFALRSPPCLSSVLFCILGVWPLQAPGWVVLSQQEALVGGGLGGGQGIGSSKGVSLPISALGIISGKAPVSVTHQGSRLARSPQPPGSRYPTPAFFPPRPAVLFISCVTSLELNSLCFKYLEWLIGSWLDPD